MGQETLIDHSSKKAQFYQGFLSFFLTLCANQLIRIFESLVIVCCTSEVLQRIWRFYMNFLNFAVVVSRLS